MDVHLLFYVGKNRSILLFHSGLCLFKDLRCIPFFVLDNNKAYKNSRIS